MILRRLRRAVFAGGAAALLLGTGGWALDHAFPPALGRLADLSQEVTASDGATLRLFTAGDARWRLPVALDDVDPLFLAMLIAREDKRFFSHPGIDPLAVGRAALQAIGAGHIVSGASTLTMQTVRLLEPRPRTLASKLIEMARALQLESRFDKREILAMYLTLAPYGGNIEGLRAASLLYLGKEPATLTPAEAALLVALPQSPESLRPDRAPAAAAAARARVLDRAAGMGLLTIAAAAEAAADRLPALRRDAPMLAPHLAERLLREGINERAIATLIDGDLQARLERLAYLHATQWSDGVSVAILVVENETRAVRGYVGAADYFDTARFGPIDMVQAVRSPGSTLKPFLYAMGFESRLLHPETLMLDAQTRFGNYAPQNFDGGFRGDVTAEAALQQSLNVPAVALLDRIGPASFLARLRGAGMRVDLPRPEIGPGLPIILGGLGTTLEDLVAGYAGLAEGGVMKPLRFRPDDPDMAGGALTSPLGAWYVARILEGLPPPPDRLAGADRPGAPLVAYKTGTSYGYRDAWAIGFDARYTIGVWVGRPDGSFASDRMGRDTAAPLLFDAFDLLDRPALLLTRERPSGPPPGDALLVASTASLPAPLQRFQREASRIATSVATAIAAGPSIAFPVDGTRLPLGDDASDLLPLALEARGGQLPLLWLVNGEAVPTASWKRRAAWQPDGAGQVRVTVVDSDGRHASVDIWIE
ncbi:MAG: penicillin-binding protein 1C [Dongiaceae bacterium]